MFFSSYSQNNIASSEIKNSIFNILPYNLKSFKNKKIKIHNIIRGSYKDKILDDLVYVSSSNINKDFFLRKDKQKLFSTEKAFISHLNLENNNNIIDFHHYCNTYYRQFYKLFLQKQYYYSLYNFPQRRLHSERYKSKSWFDYSNWKNIIQNPALNFQTNILFPIKHRYGTRFLTTHGVLYRARPRLFNFSTYSGLINILPSEGKLAFRRMLILFYLCLKFFIKNINIIKDYKIKYSIQLYTLLYKYNIIKFERALKKKKIKLRKSNSFLRNYKFLLKRKFVWIISFIKNYSNLKEHNSAILNFNDFKSLNLETKVQLFKKLIFYLQLRDFSSESSSSILASYLKNKNTLFKELLYHYGKMIIYNHYNLMTKNWSNDVLSMDFPVSPIKSRFNIDLLVIYQDINSKKKFSTKKLKLNWFIDFLQRKKSKIKIRKFKKKAKNLKLKQRLMFPFAKLKIKFKRKTEKDFNITDQFTVVPYLLPKLSRALEKIKRKAYFRNKYKKFKKNKAKIKKMRKNI